MTHRPLGWTRAGAPSFVGGIEGYARGKEVILVDKPRPHRNVWIGMAVIGALLLIGLMIAYGGGSAGSAGGY
jgi:hypothetical protein